jgi:hypothetical protein
MNVGNITVRPAFNPIRRHRGRPFSVVCVGLHDPERARLYRERAAELLMQAEQLADKEQRRTLLAIAATYHRLAKELEEDSEQ